MTNVVAAPDWRQARRTSAREAIVAAAWALVAEEGLAGLSLRDLARRAGITPPTVYAYFTSKNAIYDAMFGQAANDFADAMAEPYKTGKPREMLAESVRRFFEFCARGPARYQLLFQRTLPSFEPSVESFAPMQRALAGEQELLARNGVTDARHLDMFTALVSGLVSQQFANDPGGDRWTSLAEESLAMFLDHCSSRTGSLKLSPLAAGKRPGRDHHND
ncbi:MAG TPA: TetR/AcrR family transcriptional regulator [Acidimicrobiales bacterium]|nr:TetR/AcrR family transcriptional regulator [Acidimicrobiales bacterium]